MKEESRLIESLDEYVNEFRTNTLTSKRKDLIQAITLNEDDPLTFKDIASNIWDKYSCVDPYVIVIVLRRWIEIDPDSQEAKKILAGYMLAHGPDWDTEAENLLSEVTGQLE